MESIDKELLLMAEFSLPGARTGPTRPSSALELAARLGSQAWSLTVVDSFVVSESMRRLRFGTGNSALSFVPGQDLTLIVGRDGGDTVRRRYTIRHADESERLVDLDFVMHGDGPAIRWASAVATGETIEAVGPRGLIGLDASVDWYLFIGDDAFIPASFVMIEAIPPTKRATAFLEVASKDDEQLIETHARLDCLNWVHRGITPPGKSTALIDRLASYSLPAGRGHAYVGGEFRFVSAIRKLLLSLGFSADEISSKAYWRLGSANANHGEPPRE